jgi:hypothetical protein
MKNFFLLITGLALAVMATGCELNVNAKKASTDSPGSSTTQQTTPDTASTLPPATSTPPATTPPVTQPAATGDALDISGAALLGPHAGIKAGSAAVTRAMHSADIGSGKVRMSFDALNWSTDNGTDGGVYIFWVEGSQVFGGWFDWHGVGQTVKGLENIYGGYLDMKQPPSGATVYFAIVSLNGSERTSVAQSPTKW